MENKIEIKCRGIIFHEGKLFLVKHIRSSGAYALPGGKLENGEEILGTLKREIFEELGVRAEVGRLLYVNNYIDVSGINYIEFFFEIKNGKDFVDTDSFNGAHKEELLEMVWKEKEDDIKILPEQIQIDFKNGKLLEQGVKFI